jgi:hypothetical protein
LIPQTDKISLYADPLAGTKEIIAAQVRIKKSFPALPAGFYDTLDDRIRENGFTVQRLKDAVSYVIDNCPYPTPMIANFISYDKTIKFRTYNEMLKEAVPYEINSVLWKEWLPVKFPHLPATVWVHANDVARYDLSKYQVK